MICRICKINKPVTDFYSAPRNKSGYQSDCKICYNTRGLEYSKQNSAKIKHRQQVWYKKNRAKVLEYQKKYRMDNQDKIRKCRGAWEKKKIKDPLFKLKKILRIRLYDALKDNHKTGSAVEDLGCTIKELKQRLESKFQPGMTWDNWGIRGWHIDHIKPLASFDLADREQLLEVCHYTNLQPLWAEDNRAKRDKLISLC